VSSFVLPEDVWRDDFYQPMQLRVNSLRTKYTGNREASEVLEACQREIDMYTKYSRYYSYVFYIMQST
jgi:hypothetical protein